MSRSEREGDGSALRNRELAKSRFDTYWLGSIVVRTGPELLAYRILVSLLFPLALPVLALRASRQRGGFSGLIERWTGPREHPFSQDTPVLWVHAASNGEVTSARPLIEDALERDTELHVFLTTNSITAQELVATWKLPRVVTGLAPFDLRRTVGRFLDRVAPRALLVIENEIWPNRFDLCAARGIPVLLAGARMSARSGQRWTMISSVFGGMGRRLKEAVVAVAAQDAESEHRFLQWGLAPQKILPRLNLKSTVALAEVDIDTRQAFERQMSRNRTLLAASTHEGEEEVVLDAFARILATHPDARLIIAPRHPNRRADILAQVRRLGLTCASRSRGEMPDDAQVYLADTLGEMALWYRLSCTTFVGGSLGDRGGHTPFEPAQFGTAIVHGPDVQNHITAYRVLTNARGAKEVGNAEELAQTWQSLLSHPEQVRALADAAEKALEPLRVSPAGYEAFWRKLAQVSNREKLAGK